MYKPQFYIILFLLAFKVMGQKDTLEIQRLLNKAYSLKQNPIETYFSLIKKHFRRGLLENYKNSVNS